MSEISSLIPLHNITLGTCKWVSLWSELRSSSLHRSFAPCCSTSPIGDEGAQGQHIRGPENAAFVHVCVCVSVQMSVRVKVETWTTIWRVTHTQTGHSTYPINNIKNTWHIKWGVINLLQACLPSHCDRSEICHLRTIIILSKLLQVPCALLPRAKPINEASQYLTSTPQHRLWHLRHQPNVETFFL